MGKLRQARARTGLECKLRSVALFCRIWHAMEVPEQGRACLALASPDSSGEHWRNRQKTGEPIKLLHLVNVYW